MCASYGLDPRIGDYKSFLQAGDEAMVENLLSWARSNDGELVRPTGKNLRNLNPIVHGNGADRRVELAWWGYLIGGEPAKFPSINTRSEKLREKPGGLGGRAIVPATSWLEMQKPSRDWYSFATGDLFGMAAVTQWGKPTGGEPVTCYSIVMQPASPELEQIHDRMPLLLPQSFFDEWLDAGDEPSRDLIDAALAAGEELSRLVTAVRV